MGTVTLTSSGVFDGYTLTQLRALCLRMLRVSDTTRFSPTAGTADYDWIDDALNRGQDDFVRLTRCLKSYAICEIKANQRLYRFPSDYLDMINAYYYSSSLTEGYRTLIVCSAESLNEEVDDYRTASGSPYYLYPDRNYGQGQTFGLYPIPDTAGDTPTFSSDYGVAVQWVCPLYTYSQDVGTLINVTSVDEFILPSQEGIVVDVEVADGNIFMEYVRLPQELNGTTQISEVPREYQKALGYYAAHDLLSNEPEDSAEYKRSQYYDQKFKEEVAIYVNKQKRPITATHLRLVPAAWSYVKNTTWYKEIP
jgi:hypothetical protein